MRVMIKRCAGLDVHPRRRLPPLPDTPPTPGVIFVAVSPRAGAENLPLGVRAPQDG